MQIQVAPVKIEQRYVRVAKHFLIKVRKDDIYAEADFTLPDGNHDV